MLKRVIDHIQAITFDVEYTVTLQDADEILKFKCYSPNGVRHKWVLKNVDTDSYVGTDHDFELRHFALAIYQIDSMPVCQYFRDEMKITLPDILDEVSDSPHNWVWATNEKDNQVVAIANQVYDILGRLPFEIQESLVKLFRTQHSVALGVSNIVEEFNRVDDLLKLLEQQAQEMTRTESEKPTSSPSKSNSTAKKTETTSVDNQNKKTPSGMKLSEGANDESAFFVPAHKSTREYELHEKQQRQDAAKKDLSPEVVAAMEHTEKSYRR